MATKVNTCCSSSQILQQVYRQIRQEVTTTDWFVIMLLVLCKKVKLIQSINSSEGKRDFHKDDQKVWPIFSTHLCYSSANDKESFFVEFRCQASCLICHQIYWRDKRIAVIFTEESIAKQSKDKAVSRTRNHKWRKFLSCFWLKCQCMCA